MARNARATLADARALEEQNARNQMHGGARFIGAGGVPSMGLSQFVGGAHNSSSDDEACKMCGGAGAPAGTTYRLATQRGGPRAYQGPPIGDLVPYVPQPVRGPLTRYTPPRAAPPTSTAVAVRTPGTVRPYNPAEAAFRLAAARGAPVAPPATRVAVPTRADGRMPLSGRVAALLAAGVPLALIGTMIADAATAPGASAADVGYYDDYAAQPDVDADGIPDFLDPDSLGPFGAPAGDYGAPAGPAPSGPPRAGPSEPLPPVSLPAANLTRSEVDLYLRSGNLPDRFYASPRSRRGAGKPASGRRAERAAIVKKVMAEKGMKLIEASRYVKQNNLF